MIVRLAPLLLILTLAACGDYPRDPDDTLNRVQSTHVFRVGLIAPDDGPAAERFIRRVTHTTGARAEISRGGTEPLLLELERGTLDLVIGELANDSPWVDRVTIIEPLATRGAITLNPIAKNGENAWIMLLEREARTSTGAKP